MLSFYILFVCVMGHYVTGTHIEYKDDIEEVENIKQEIERQRKQSKRVDAGMVIEAAGLTMAVLKNVLDAIASVSRKIAIGVDNETPYKWEALNAYFLSGSSDVVLPEFVKKGEAAVYAARKSSGPVARGSVGAFAYYMQGSDATIVIMFSVPYDYNLYENWWDAKVYSGRKRANYNMWYEMYHGNPYKGDNGYHQKAIGKGFRVKGLMTSAGECVMELKIFT